MPQKQWARTPIQTFKNIWESEAPAELATLRFGRSLNLPSNEFVGQSRKKHVWSGRVNAARKIIGPIH